MTKQSFTLLPIKLFVKRLFIRLVEAHQKCRVVMFVSYIDIIWLKKYFLCVQVTTDKEMVRFLNKLDAWESNF